MPEKPQLLPLEAVWGTVKNLVKKGHPDIGAMLGSMNEYSRDVPKIIHARNDRWLRPRTPVTATDDLLQELTHQLAKKIEAVFCEKFVEIPQVQIVKKDDFLPMINGSERETSNQLGYGFNQFESPPTMYTDQTSGRVVLPENFLIRFPKGVYLGAIHRDFEVQEHQWDQPFLEQVFCEELSHVMFRQLRGEWRQGFIDCMKAVCNSAANISAVNEAVALRVKALNVFDDRDQWGVFVAVDMLSDMQNPSTQIAYRGVEGLAQHKSMGQISMLDHISSERGELKVGFDSQHPNNDGKLQKYNATAL